MVTYFSGAWRLIDYHKIYNKWELGPEVLELTQYNITAPSAVELAVPDKDKTPSDIDQEIC